VAFRPVTTSAVRVEAQLKSVDPAMVLPASPDGALSLDPNSKCEFEER